MLWLSRPQVHTKESRRWRRQGCRRCWSSGSPPWPGCSMPANRCGSSDSAMGCSSPAAAAPSPVGCGPAPPGGTSSVITTCSAVSDARPPRAPPPARQGAPLAFPRDDSPTKRYGPHGGGAGTHHNPTPGPAGSKFLDGHVWVGLARLVRHPRWGTIALPILSLLYIRAKDVGWMAAYYGWQFRTKRELAAALIEWLVPRAGGGRPPPCGGGGRGPAQAARPPRGVAGGGPRG